MIWLLLALGCATVGDEPRDPPAETQPPRDLTPNQEGEGATTVPHTGDTGQDTGNP